MGNYIGTMEEDRALRSIKQPIVIFGSGAFGEMALEYLIKQGFEEQIIGFCDNNENKQGKLIKNKPIYSYMQLKSLGEDLIFIICSMYSDEIEDQLIKNGERNIRTYLLPPIEQANIHMNSVCKEWSKSNKSKMIEKIFKVRDMMEDDRSQEVLEGLIKMWDTGEWRYSIAIKSKLKAQYFDSDIWTLTDHETFVDVGAYNGDTIDDFILRVEGKYNKIIALEPSEELFRQLERQTSIHDNIILHNIGAWYESGILSFNTNKSNLGSSMIEEQGEEVITVNKLDNILIDIPVTLIKMDIEGAEKEALEGAKNTILKYKPKLAICVYHKIDDICDIPMFIKKLVPEYKFYLRHYSYSACETVLYAMID